MRRSGGILPSSPFRMNQRSWGRKKVCCHLVPIYYCNYYLFDFFICPAFNCLNSLQYSFPLPSRLSSNCAFQFETDREGASARLISSLPSALRYPVCVSTTTHSSSFIPTISRQLRLAGTLFHIKCRADIETLNTGGEFT